MTTTYTISADGRSIRCNRCGMTSSNANDVQQRYCGNCKLFLDQMERHTAMAVLLIDDKVHATCVGCSEMLYWCGALKLVHDVPLNDHQPFARVHVYQIAEGYTLEDCRRLIGRRHLDSRPWGAP